MEVHVEQQEKGALQRGAKEVLRNGHTRGARQKTGGLDAMIHKGKDKYTTDKMKLLKVERAKWKAELDKVAWNKLGHWGVEQSYYEREIEKEKDAINLIKASPND